MLLRYLAALAALCLGLAAHAEGISKAPSIAARAQAEEPPAWNRTGFYVGAVGGYDVTVLEAEGVNFGNGQLMAGVIVGWNYKVNPQLVVGVEGDWIFTGISSATDVGGITVSASQRHLVSLRARAGVPMGPALLYATAGPAWQHNKITVAGLATDESEWQLGGVVGAGAELELTRSLFVRLEALHYIFPESSDAPLSTLFDSENQHTTARVGVGFKLN